MKNLKIGDQVVCNVIDLKHLLTQTPNLLNYPFIYGEIIKIYDVTGMGRQVMIKTKNGLKFHAPIEYWIKI